MLGLGLGLVLGLGLGFHILHCSFAHRAGVSGSQPCIDAMAVEHVETR